MVTPEMIVVTDEIAASLHHLLGDVAMPPVEQLLALFEDGRSEFFTHPHTLTHYRNAWYPRLLYRGGARVWEARTSPDFEARVRQRTCQLIEQHRPDLLPAERAAAVDTVLQNQ